MQKCWDKKSFKHATYLTKTHFGTKEIGAKMNFEPKLFDKELFKDKKCLKQNIFVTKKHFGTKIYEKN